MASDRLVSLHHLHQTRKSQQSGELAFLEEVEEEASSQQSSVRELRAAHAETIQELEKTRILLNMESRISRDYKVSGFMTNSEAAALLRP